MSWHPCQLCHPLIFAGLVRIWAFPAVLLCVVRAPTVPLPYMIGEVCVCWSRRTLLHCTKGSITQRFGLLSNHTFFCDDRPLQATDHCRRVFVTWLSLVVFLMKCVTTEIVLFRTKISCFVLRPIVGEFYWEFNVCHTGGLLLWGYLVLLRMLENQTSKSGKAKTLLRYKPKILLM